MPTKIKFLSMEVTDTGARILSSIATDCPRCNAAVPANEEHRCGDWVRDHRCGDWVRAEEQGYPSIDQQAAELKKAGWKPYRVGMWKAPSGAMFLGPHGAYKAMLQGAK